MVNSKIFRWLEIEDEYIVSCLEIAVAHDMNRMGDEQIASNPHISTGKLRKWEEFFTPNVSKAYQERFADAHKNWVMSDFEDLLFFVSSWWRREIMCVTEVSDYSWFC